MGVLAIDCIKLCRPFDKAEFCHLRELRERGADYYGILEIFRFQSTLVLEIEHDEWLWLVHTYNYT